MRDERMEFWNVELGHPSVIDMFKGIHLFAITIARSARNKGPYEFPFFNDNILCTFIRCWFLFLELFTLYRAYTVIAKSYVP